MMRAGLCLILTQLPGIALAAPGDITPMARYCSEALVDSRPLMTSALIPTTAKAVGRGDADERVEFFTVPQESLVFSRITLSGLSACTVFPTESHEGWSEDSVAGHMEGLGLIPAPDCGQEGEEIWFSTSHNLKRNGVTVVVGMEDGAVREILAYETPDLIRPSDCKKDEVQ